LRTLAFCGAAEEQRKKRTPRASEKQKDSSPPPLHQQIATIKQKQMAEGGRLPWKRQVIDESRGPAADFSKLRVSLQLPSHLEWRRDGKEWRVVSVAKKEKEKRQSGAATRNDEKDGGAANRPSESSAESMPRDNATQNKVTTPEEKKNKRQQAVANVDFVYHTVLPSDTMQGLCLRYRISATKLRQANRFSGSNLLLAPPKLVIPITERNFNIMDRIQDKDSPEYKLQSFLAEFPHLGLSERRAYLDMNDWDLVRACQDAAADDAWERSQQQRHAAKASMRKNANAAVPRDVRKQLPIAVAQEMPDEMMEPLLRSELEMARRDST
jgi:LysM repeat protein